MKILKLSLIVLSVSVIIGCAPAAPNDTTTPASQNPTVATEGYILNGATKVAYVLNIEDNYAKIYIPSADRYAMINLTTGLYHSYSSVQYAGASCTGEMRASSFFGPSGKAVIFDNTSTYYRVVAPVAGVFSYQSYAYNGQCGSGPSTISNTYSVEVTARPFDFTALAPINVQFQ